MLMLRTTTVAIVLVVALLPTARAQTPNHEISLQEARSILRADPAAIPGYPVKFYRLSTGGVFVRQELDSGRVIQLREDRGAAPWLAPMYASAGEDELGRFVRGLPSLGEQRVRARQGYRKVGPVSVRYLGPLYEPVPSNLLDRLAPIS